MIQIHLPWPPSANHYWRSVPGRGVLISAQGREYRKTVADCVLLQRAAKLLEGRLEVVIHASPPDRRRRDLDNLLKSCLDALTHAGVWHDDCQIEDLRIRRDGLGGSLRIEVKEMV